MINIEKTFANKQEFCYAHLGIIKDDSLKRAICSVDNTKLFDYIRASSIYVVEELGDGSVQIIGTREIENRNEFL